MKKFIIVLALIATTSLLVVYGIFNSHFHTPANALSTPVLVEIPYGTLPGTVGDILQEKQLLEDSKLFYWYIRIHGLAPSLKSGVYEIPPGQSIAQMADFLKSGNTATHKVTIPEGRASWEIFSILKETYPKLQLSVWDSLVVDRKFMNTLGVPQKSPSLEGYLLPETYHLPWQADEKTLITILATAMSDLQKTLPLQESEVYRQYGWHGILTLASVVEEETSIAHERGEISGVFYNRLQQGIPLGADPTVRFIFRSLTGPIYKSQLASDNPYNTRRFKGLPPGPISNPGAKAIKAALFPDETENLFFVAKDDGSKEHFFCPTLRCHNAKKAVAATNRGE